MKNFLKNKLSITSFVVLLAAFVLIPGVSMAAVCINATSQSACQGSPNNGTWTPPSCDCTNANSPSLCDESNNSTPTACSSLGGFWINGICNNCQALQQQGGTCSGPQDCDVGLFCDSHKTCQPGVAGTDCSKDSEVCQTGLQCVNSVCASLLIPNGGSCGLDSDCQSNNCQSFVCAPAGSNGGKGNGFTGGIGSSCAIDSDCQSNNCQSSVCAAAGTNGGIGGTGATGGTGGGTITCPSGMTPANGLCLPPNNFNGGIAGTKTLSDLIVMVVKILLAFAGVLAVVFVVIGGYLYITAGGNEEQAEKGKKTILNFILGLALIILAYTIVTIVTATLTGADKLIPK